MLNVKDGNVVDAVLNGEVSVIMHVTNCLGIMGSGVALEIKNRIPEAYQVYRTEFERAGMLVLGEITHCKEVININGQFSCGSIGRDLNYGGFVKGLIAAIKHVKENYEDSVRVGIPYKIGSDRAGGDWSVVSDLINYFFEDAGIDVIVYKLNVK